MASLVLFNLAAVFCILSSSLSVKIAHPSKRWEVTDPKLKEAQMVINKLVDESIASRVREAQKEVETLLEKNIAKHVAETGKTLLSDQLTEDPECQDQLDNCAVLSESGVCKTSAEAMFQHCKKTCKMCTPRISIAPHLNLVFDPKSMQLMSDEGKVANKAESPKKLQHDETPSKKKSKKKVEHKEKDEHKEQVKIHLAKNVKPSLDWNKILSEVKGAAKVHVKPLKPQVEWVKYIPLKGENGKKGPILKIIKTKKVQPKLQHDEPVHKVTHKPKHVKKVKTKKVKKHKKKKGHWVDPLEDYYKSLCHPLCHINCISSCAPGCCKLGPGPKKPHHHTTKIIPSSKCHPMCETTCLDSCAKGCCSLEQEKKRAKKLADQKLKEKKRKENCHPFCLSNCLPSCQVGCCSDRDEKLREKAKKLHDAHCHPQCKEFCLSSCGPGCCSEHDEKLRAQKLQNLDEDEEPPPEGQAIPGRCPAACPESCAPDCNVECCKGLTTSTPTADPHELALQQQSLEQQKLGSTCPLGCYDLCQYGCPESCCQPGQTPAPAPADPYATTPVPVDQTAAFQPAEPQTCPGECSDSCAPECSYGCCATTKSSPFAASPPPSKVLHVTHLLTPSYQQPGMETRPECLACEAQCSPTCSKRGCCFFD